MQLYFDNAATSFPKPSTMHEAMMEYCTAVGASPGRGSYQKADEASKILDSCRQSLCRLVNAPSEDHCIFTLNCTDAINLAILGIVNFSLKNNEPVHVVTTAMDHNSVLRPLNELCAKGVTHTIVNADPATGIVEPSAIANAINQDTKLVAIAHGSNVTGSVQDLESIGSLCGSVPILLDAAQTMGHHHIDVQSMNIALLAFPGHKGLLGPLGTGGLIVRPGIEEYMLPIRTGGTGSASELPIQPSTMPDKFEAGSHNMVGIAGLNASVDWILERGVDKLYNHEQILCKAFLSEMKKCSHAKIIGPKAASQRCGVFSIVFEENPYIVAKALEECSGIQSRAGLHCAPFAHKTIGTATLGGTVRISFGPFHRMDDIKTLTKAIANLNTKASI